MSKTTEFLGWANVLNYDPSKKDAAGPVVGFPTVGFGDISNAYKTSLIPKTAPGSVGGAFSPSAFLNSVQSGGAMQSGVGAAQEQTPVGGVVGDTKDTSAGAGFVPNQILVDSLTKKLFGQKSAGEADAGKLEFDAWKGQFGIDTDKNFQDSVSRLDYDVKTWAANYGANAERLARMGLSNSGVVDVYGTGVVQAYLSAMNDLYLAKAEGDRKNAEAYKQYSDQYDADLAAQTEAKNNKILQGYNYGLGLYTGDNMDAVTTMIRNAGYDEGEISEIVARLGAVDPSMLPALQAQAQQDQTDINTAIDQLIKSGYKTEMEESVADIYRAKDWSEEKIAKLIQGVNGLAGMAPKVDKVKEKYAQIISSQSGYNSSMDGQLSQMLSVAEDWTEEEINELLGYLHDYEAAGQNGAGDQNLIAGVDAVNQMLAKANVAYDGSEELKAQIKQQLRNGEYAEIADQILAQLDADLGEVKGAAALDEIAEIEAVDADTLTMGDVEAELTDAATKYGVDSEEYKNILKSWGGKVETMFEGAFADLDEAQAVFGVADDDAIDDIGTTWSEADEEARSYYIEQRLNDAHRNGLVGDKVYMKIMNGIMKEDALKLKGNEDVASILSYLDDLAVNKTITEDQRKELMQTIAQNIKFKVTGTYRNGIATGIVVHVGNAVVGVGYNDIRVVTGDEAKKAEDAMKGGKDLCIIDTKLYARLSNGTIYEFNADSKAKGRGGDSFNELLQTYAARTVIGKSALDVVNNRYGK